jgi:hypothetical protein
MERFGKKSVGRLKSSAAGPDDTRIDSSSLSNGHASQQHSSLSGKKTKGEKQASSTENNVDEKDVIPPFPKITGLPRPEEYEAAYRHNLAVFLSGERNCEANGDSTPKKQVDPLLCTEELDSKEDSSPSPTRRSKLRAPTFGNSSPPAKDGPSKAMKQDSLKSSSTATFARGSSSASPSTPDGRRRRRNNPKPLLPTQKNKSPSPTPSPTKYSATVYASLAKPSPSPSNGGSLNQRSKLIPKRASSQVVKSFLKGGKASTAIETHGKKTSLSPLDNAVVSRTNPTASSDSSPPIAATSQKPAPTDGTGPSFVTEAFRTSEAHFNDGPRKPSSLEDVKMRAQKKVEHELSLLVAKETLNYPGMDADTEVAENEVTGMELAKLPEESTVLRHESWKKLHELDNASAEKRGEAGRAARLALRRESQAYSKSINMKLQTPNIRSMSSAPTGDAFTSTPPSASATYTAIRGTQFKLTQENVRRAIPANASCVVHVLDRRVNLDACAPDASHYSLLRAWVQDDPCRQIPPPGSNIFESVPLSTCISEGLNADVFPSKKRKIETTGTCNVLDSLVNASEHDSAPSLNSLRDQLVTNGKRLRREKRREEKVWMNATRENLKSMGIDLPTVSS